MNLKNRLQSDLKTAMREKEILVRDSIRSINTMIKQIEVDERKELNDEDIIKLIEKGIKQREQAALAYQEANRHDLEEKEKQEITIFKRYLPQQLSDQELEEHIQTIIHELGDISLKDMGKIMGMASKRLSGKATGKRINEMAKKLLG